MPARAMQSDDPAALPRLPERPPSRLLEAPDEARDRQVAQLAGAVGALARKVDTIGRPPVTIAERRAALEIAREFVTAGATVTGPARIQAELSIARYLTGE